MEKAAFRNLENIHSEVNVTDLENEETNGFNDKDFLRDSKTDQKSLAKRDAGDLFAASALASDKDVKLTEREMSLPSAFYSRRGFGDSAHAVGELSDSEEAGVDNRPNLSVTVSGPLNTDRSVGLESETNGDNTQFLGHCAKEDLDLIENAILRILPKDVRASSEQNGNAGATTLKDAPGISEHSEGSEVSSAGSVDLQLLSRLLDQVETLRDQKFQHKQVGRAARSSSPSDGSVLDFCKRRNDKERRLKNGEMKKAVEAATQAAKSAADAAKVASSLATKNSEAVNKLLQSVIPYSSKTTFNHEKQEKDKQRSHPDSSDSDESSESEEMKDIAKKIVAQNRYTHVVLGLTLVTSFVWRYIVVKLAKRVRNKVNDPWGYVQGKLTDNFAGLQKEKEPEDAKERSNPDGFPKKLKL